MVIGVDPKTYKAWEGGGPPTSHHWPAIIAFLGSDPVVEPPVTIPQMVSTLRRRKGLTANELGKLLGVYKLTVRAWEAGRRQPRGRVLRRLCDLAARYGLKFSMFYVGTDPRSEGLDYSWRENEGWQRTPRSLINSRRQIAP